MVTKSYEIKVDVSKKSPEEQEKTHTAINHILELAKDICNEKTLLDIDRSMHSISGYVLCCVDLGIISQEEADKILEIPLDISMRRIEAITGQALVTKQSEIN